MGKVVIRSISEFERVYLPKYYEKKKKEKLLKKEPHKVWVRESIKIAKEMLAKMDNK
jgi:hypothetical protein